MSGHGIASTAVALLIAGVIATLGCTSRATTDEPTSKQADAASPPPPLIDASPVQVDAIRPSGPRQLEGSERDEPSALASVGAIPVWRAVIDRWAYLARRGSRGVVYGRVGGPVADDDAADDDAADDDAYVWLIDETQGAGSLSIRLSIAAGVEQRPTGLNDGDRIVAWGNWHLDASRTWYWRANRISYLPRRPWIPIEHRSVFGHRIIDIPVVPDRAVPVSEIDYPGGLIVFQIVRASADPDDGWEIADVSADKPVGRLYLPGERESYGSLDWRSPDEHWRLDKGMTYVVRLRRFLPAKPGQLPNMPAVDAPRRIVPRPVR